MKKIISILWTAVFCFCMCITVVSATSETVGKNDSKEIHVTARYQSTITTPDVYSVDISWSNMTFTYIQNGSKVWDASSHSYQTNTEERWDKTTATVTVTNHSNVQVNVVIEYIATGDTGIIGTLSNASATLNAGVENNYAGADSHTAVLTISGKPNHEITFDGVEIGTVKVIIQ